MINSRPSISEFIVTFCYIGKIKYCPGTFGSLAAIPFAYSLLYLLILCKLLLPIQSLSIEAQGMLGLLLGCILVTIIIATIGIYCSSRYMAYTKQHDPKEIVIDEVVGQMLTLIICFASSVFMHNSKLLDILGKDLIDWIFILILPFILFRLFDILKPWPICWIDSNINNAFGVMLDDVLAAIFASITQYAIVFLLLDIL